jgi:hypothetical protein
MQYHGHYLSHYLDLSAGLAQIRPANPAATYISTMKLTTTLTIQLTS